MNEGTKQILDCLKRQRSFSVAEETFLDLISDIDRLGESAFVRAALDATVRSTTSTKRNSKKDPFVQRFHRYRQRSGMKTSTFISLLSEILEIDHSLQIPASNKGSAPKFLSYIQTRIDAEVLESAMGRVLEKYA